MLVRGLGGCAVYGDLMVVATAEAIIDRFAGLSA
jgi:hypothetical protein